MGRRDDRQGRDNRRRDNRRRGGNSKKKSRISDHFSKKDFLCGETGKLRISLGLVGALEMLRSQSKQRVNIVKGYMSPDAVEGPKKQYKKDYHTMGLAADITIDEMDIVDVFKLAESIDEVKGLGINVTEHHVHIDTRKSDERVCWVEDRGDIIDLTDANRDRYIT